MRCLFSIGFAPDPTRRLSLITSAFILDLSAHPSVCASVMQLCKRIVVVCRAVVCVCMASSASSRLRQPSYAEMCAMSLWRVLVQHMQATRHRIMACMTNAAKTTFRLRRSFLCDVHMCVAGKSETLRERAKLLAHTHWICPFVRRSWCAV